MTAQEKAIELVYKYKDAPFNCLGCDMPYCDAPCTMLNIDESKQCALIAVNELIEVTASIEASDYYFWIEVKKEIERL